MKLNTLSPAEGSKKNRKRVGRGIGSTDGKTAGRGHKGQKARAGGFHKVGFEGGQMPLQRRVPKYGFKNVNRVEYKSINISTLQSIVEKHNIEKIDLEVLIKTGFVNKNALVKILGNGTLDRKIEVHAHAFSKSAKEAIEAKQGTVVIL